MIELPRRWTRAFLVVSVAWTAVAVLFAGQLAIYFRSSGQPYRWSQILLWSVVDWYTMGALTPLVVWLARRYRFERARSISAVAAHVCGAWLYGFFTTVLHSSTAHLLTRFVTPPPFVLRRISQNILDQLLDILAWDVMIYAAIVAITAAVDSSRRLRERDVRASQLETQLAHAQLQALKTQLQPHFLFNTLNSISALVQKDPRGADRMIARLADLLRHSLEMNGNQEVPLRQEIELLQKYLDIQKTRFRERLRVELQIDASANDILVPNLILQPIVENAILHGISARRDGGRVTIRASVAGTVLDLEVSDDGPGFADLPPTTRGLGLANTTARLQHLYGLPEAIELSNAPEGGAVARIRIPVTLSRAERPDD